MLFLQHVYKILLDFFWHTPTAGHTLAFFFSDNFTLTVVYYRKSLRMPKKGPNDSILPFGHYYIKNHRNPFAFLSPIPDFLLLFVDFRLPQPTTTMIEAATTTEGHHRPPPPSPTTTTILFLFPFDSLFHHHRRAPNRKSTSPLTTNDVDKLRSTFYLPRFHDFVVDLDVSLILWMIWWYGGCRRWWWAAGGCMVAARGGGGLSEVVW
ncbi:hypothetical protein Dimus_038447 [Dionaea muscipula]